MRRLIACLPFLLWSAGAQALSCMPHDVAATYFEAQNSDDRFMVVVGTLSFDETRLPQTDMQNQMGNPPDTLIPAQLKGRALNRTGFEFPYDEEITLNAQCFGAWCAGATSGIPYLAFVNLDRDVPEVTINPCGGYAFAKPTREMEKQVIACRNGGTCEPKLHR